MLNQSQKTINLLIKLGLNETESQIYLYLLSGQKQTVLDLSRALDIPRTTVYDALEKLKGYSLVEKIIGYKTCEYKASSPKLLEGLLEKETEHLKTLDEAYRQLQRTILTENKDGNSTEVRYYHGVQGMKQIVWNSLKAKRETVGWSVFGRVEVMGNSFYQKWVREFERLQLKDRVIANPTPKSMNYLYKYANKPGLHQLSFQDIRLLPKTVIDIQGDTLIYNNVYAVSYWHGEKIVGFEIEDADFANTQKTIFESLWKTGRVIRPRH